MEPSSSSGFVYETLAPISTVAESSVSDPCNSYAVFRTQLSSAPSAADLEIAATDYFALDSADPSRPQTPPPIDTELAAPVQQHQTPELAWFRSTGRFKSPMLQLHKEIVDFCNFVSPTPEEQAARAMAVQCVFDVIKYIWPHSKPEVFGSFKTGLYLPTSDIDVVILDSKVKTPQIGLHALSKALSQRNIAKKIQVIAKARVPIIKFVEKKSEVSFDISFDVSNGPEAAEFIKDAVIRMPPLRPLCLILKVFLQQRELNEVYSGGIGSYALLSMLIAHLQIHWRGQDFQGCQTSLEHNLGILLINFFDFYGRKLNIWDVGISCKEAGTFFLKSRKGFLKTDRPYLLSIEDPQAPDNDIGRNSFNFFQIRSAFAMAYSLLTDAKTILALGPERSILGTIIRPDPVLLERKGGCDGEVTFYSLLPGAGDPVQRQPGNDSEILCNWLLDDDEPLPREKKIAGENTTPPSLKRKALKAKQVSEGKVNGSVNKNRHKENSERKENKRWRGEFPDGNDECGGSSSGRRGRFWWNRGR